MARLSSVFLVLLLHVVLLITSPLCEGTKFRHSSSRNHVVAFFIFGDSFLDAGNNNYINTTTLDQANFWPYGETYFKFPTGRFSDGRLVSDFIAEYANLPLIPPFLQPGFRHYYAGVNFASSGAGALVETFQGSVIDLKTQLRYYKKVETWLRHKLGNVGAEVTLSKAVYLFSIGTNDYMSLFLTNSTKLKTYSESQYVEMVIGNLTSVIKEIYTIGGRKFGFMNLPTLGCFPGIRIVKQDTNGSCLKEASSLANLHNEALSKLLKKLSKRLKGFKYSLYDLNNNLKLRINHPYQYGFKEGKAACCGTGQFRGVFSCGGKRKVREFQLCENSNDYVFWDSYHLTEKVYKQLADQMWGGAGNSHTVGPYNLKDLFQAH
ncbi:Lipase [Trema orientale]|uniref:Lipase n=1 Tax=Trema orientale TaxID=63057 RepID=A0A2P5CNA1_TREOI|nr:Lipase [Trema orientale]